MSTGEFVAFAGRGHRLGMRGEVSVSPSARRVPECPSEPENAAAEPAAGADRAAAVSYTDLTVPTSR